jgi:alpha-amylase
MCYNKVTYAPDRRSATVEATCRKHDSIRNVQYNWNGTGFSSSSTFQAGSTFNGDLTLEVKATDGDGKDFEITVEKTNFIWQAPHVSQPENYKSGQKGAIVELFGWPYADVKQECAFLA